MTLQIPVYHVMFKEVFVLENKSWYLMIPDAFSLIFLNFPYQIFWFDWVKPISQRLMQIIKSPRKKCIFVSTTECMEHSNKTSKINNPCL